MLYIMTYSELEKKWQSKIKNLLQKDSIPEMLVKSLLKQNLPELSSDLDLVFKSSHEKVSLGKFVIKMINFAIANQHSYSKKDNLTYLKLSNTRSRGKWISGN